MLRRAVQRPALILLLLLPLVAACAATGGDQETITPKELLERMGTDDAPIVLDVRSPFEFRMGHVPGAYNLEDRQVPSRIAELKQLADREIVVYCEVGPRARWVESYLKQNGFTNVRHLQGDFAGWQRSGHPVE
jgi:phage shock protein E